MNLSPETSYMTSLQTSVYASASTSNRDTSSEESLAISIDDVRAAASRIAGRAVRTPLLESPLLNERIGGRLLVKPECLQKTGSFKFRGAYNKISALGDTAKNGVLAYSSGNHAQGVALTAKMFGVKATIVMPKDAPEIKIANTKAYGADVVFYDRYTENREEVGAEILAKTGAALIKPYDDPYVMAGQGTAGLEIAAQCEEIGATPTSLLVCCGGGGLTAGVATAFKNWRPETTIFAVEPTDFDDTARSIENGMITANDPSTRSICDAIVTPRPGDLTFPINRRYLSGVVTVSDEEVLEAMKIAFTDLKLVVEPGGAVALAAALNAKIDVEGQTTAVVISGGNVDPDLFQKALSL